MTEEYEGNITSQELAADLQEPHDRFERMMSGLNDADELDPAEETQQEEQSE